MSKLLYSFFLIVSLSLCVQAGAADGKSFPGVKKLMTVEEFEETGLDKLSDAELKALNTWLVRYTAGDAGILREKNEEVLQAKKETEILSRIKGDFKGWTGETVFRLENGQVWRQRLSGRYTYVGPANPEVKITRNFMGFYKMTVIGTNRGVGVKLVH